MTEHERRRRTRNRVKPADDQPKIVAEMPQDPEMRNKLQETKENDGYPGSCGI